MKDTVVVAAAIVRDSRLLAARRTQPPHLAGRWELPGGKVEAGETERAALVREIDEELGVLVAVGDQLGPAVALGSTSSLHVFNASLLVGEPHPRQAHSAVRWLAAGELATVDWVEADRPAVALLAARLDAHRPASPPEAPATWPPAPGVDQRFQGSDGVLDEPGDDRSLGLFRGRVGSPTRPVAPDGESCPTHGRGGSGEYVR